MTGKEDAPAEEIVIIRRRGGEGEEGHHGGAWKIAYADFMTAMMALFLVMWLINASNTETKVSVAAYFNPNKLTDTVSRTKGLQDPVEKATENGKAGGEATPQKAENKKKHAEKGKSEGVQGGVDKGKEDKSQFSVVFDKAPAAHLERGAGVVSASTHGKAFRDPFQPGQPDQSLAADGIGKQAVGRPQADARSTEGSKLQLQDPTTGDAASATLDSKESPVAIKQAALEAQAQKVLESAQKAAQPFGTQVGGPGIDVKVEGDSVVLNLTDTTTFGMFGIGSAEPNEAMLKLMQTLAPVVLQNGEQIAVRGHTDARPYRNERNNNWRLSMARAEAAMSMLVRAGVEEARFERIEAYADRKLKVPESPEAAGNRRIEIVLRQKMR